MLMALVGFEVSDLGLMNPANNSSQNSGGMGGQAPL